MKTELLDIKDLPSPAAQSALSRAADVLRGGGLVAIPTETVYGLAANALDGAAVRGIFEAKGRPQDNPLIVHVAGADMLAGLVTELPAGAGALMEQFWPGPLTLVLPKSAAVPDATTAGLGSVAVRMPSHPGALALIRMAGVPLAAPSANLSGRPSPTTAAHCVQDLTDKVELILDGGECEVGVESTVLSLVHNPPRLLRPGAVSLEQLRAVLPDVVLDPAVTAPLAEGEAAASPGLKYRHYAPRARLTLIHGSFGQFLEQLAERAGSGGLCALVFSGEAEGLPCPALEYGGEHNAGEQARELFGRLRELDSMGAELVLVRAPGRAGVGLAVYNRLLRAAAFEEIYCDG